MGSLARKATRAHERAARKTLTKQVFIWRGVWDEFVAQVKADGFEGTAENALHALLANWLQGRQDVKKMVKEPVKGQGLIQVVPGGILSKIEAEEKEQKR